MSIDDLSILSGDRYLIHQLLIDLLSITPEYRIKYIDYVWHFKKLIGFPRFFNLKNPVIHPPVTSVLDFFWNSPQPNKIQTKNHMQDLRFKCHLYGLENKN